MEVPARSEIKIGMKVWAVEKKNYASGILTEGIVMRILTNKSFHPRGTKVMFEDGTVARVQRLTPPEDIIPKTTESEVEVQESNDIEDDFMLR